MLPLSSARHPEDAAHSALCRPVSEGLAENAATCLRAVWRDEVQVPRLRGHSRGAGEVYFTQSFALCGRHFDRDGAGVLGWTRAGPADGRARVPRRVTVLTQARKL